jgi:hypothetical protein
MLKRVPSDQLEEESKLALHQLVNSLNHQNVLYSRDNFGIDGEVRLVRGVEHTGKGFKYQLKAGSSYISSENQEVLRVKVESKYVHLWQRMREPVVLIFYHPDSKILYWKAVQPFLKIRPDLLKKDATNVVVPLDKEGDILDQAAFAALELVADGQFGYQKIIYSKETSEVMLTNRFPVQELPNIIYVAPTEYADRYQIIQRLNHFYTFRLERGRKGISTLHTFSDLGKPNVELGKFCDVASCEKLGASDIPHTQYMALLNRLILINALQMDLALSHDRYYFHERVLKEGRNMFGYEAVKGSHEERAKVYQRRNDLLHHAAKIRLVREMGTWYLEVDPDWHVSIPGDPDASPREIGRRITKEKAATKNGRYRYELHFWMRYLSKNSPVIDFPCDTVGSGQRILVSAHCVSIVSQYTLFNDYDGSRDATSQG